MNPVTPDNTITGKSIAVLLLDTICSASRCICPNACAFSPVVLKYCSNAVVQLTCPTVASLIYLFFIIILIIALLLVLRDIRLDPLHDGMPVDLVQHDAE